MTDEGPLPPDLAPLDPADVRIAGYQRNPGGETTAISIGLDDPDADYSELRGVHRVLFQVEGTDGQVHWYWTMGDVLDPQDATYRIMDLQYDREHYPELT